MLDLRPVSRALDEHHQRAVDNSVVEGLRRPAFLAVNLSGYEPVVVARGRAAWQNRTLGLQAALVVTARFLSDLTEMGTSSDIQGLASRAVRDRSIHIELARRMSVVLGGKDAIPGTPAVPPALDADVRTRVLDTVVSALCVQESIAMRLLVEMARHTSSDIARAIIERIAADAAIHSRLGWTMLDIVMPALSPDERTSVVRRMPDAFSRAFARYVPTPVSTGTRPGAPLHPFGSLDAALRTSVYDDAIRPVIARFEKLSLPGTRARDEGHRRRMDEDAKRGR